MVAKLKTMISGGPSEARTPAATPKPSESPKCGIYRSCGVESYFYMTQDTPSDCGMYDVGSDSRKEPC
jgi:hypothetical protein